MGALRRYNTQTGQWDILSGGPVGFTGSSGSIGFTGSAASGITGYSGSAGGAGALNSAGSGGSGVVIIRYPNTYADATSTTGSPEYTNSGGYKSYKFTSSGSVTW